MVNLVEAWKIHQKMNNILLGALSEEGLNASVDKSEKCVRDHFIHMHNVRLLWLNLSMPCELIGLVKIKKDEKPSREELIRHIESSSEGVINLLSEAESEKKKIKGFKSSPAAFLAYMVAHESHHRGQIMILLKQAGYPVDKKTAYKLWEWDRLED